MRATAAPSATRLRPTHLAALAASVALLILFATSGAAASADTGSGGQVTIATEPLCTLPDDTHLAEAADLTEAGHLSHEDWIANESAQEEVRAINAALDGFPRTPASSENPEEMPMSWTISSGIMGVTLDNVSQTMLVVIDPTVIDGDEVEAILTPLVEQLQVQIVPGCHSVQDVAAAEETIQAREWHGDAATSTYGFYFDPSTSTFVFTFSEDAGKVAEALAATLPEFVDVSVGLPSRLGRMDDGQPHYGGAGIGTQNNIFCTSGFTAAKAGAKGSVTAAHCFASNGLNVWSGPMYYGLTADRQPFPTYDMIRIAPNGQTFTNRIHVDPCCPSVRTVTAKGDTSVNEFVCLSGQKTRAVCGVKVVSMSGEFCDPGCTVNLGYGEKPGYTIAQPGDSGGPVYNRFSTSNAAIRGMIIARDNPWNVYFHKISRIEARLGVTVSTAP